LSIKKNNLIFFMIWKAKKTQLFFFQASISVAEINILIWPEPTWSDPIQ